MLRNTYEYGTSETNEIYNRCGTYSKGVFTAELPECTGMWFYYGYYPYQKTEQAQHYVNIPFGSERVQNGNEFNSAYDIMCAECVAVDDAEQGKTDSGDNITFNMVRQTALLYFHFTTDGLDEPLTKATLTVEGDPIAAETYSLYYYGDNLNKDSHGTSWTSGDSQSITITFRNAPSSKDFNLWFNILPYAEGLRENGIENIKLVVETETKTFSITNPNTDLDLYEAGQIHSITSKVPDTAWKDKTTPEENKLFFYESFDKNDGKGGNDDKWNNISGGTSSPSYDNNGWGAQNGYAANKCVRFGAGDKTGSITSPALGITSNAAKISFKAAAWNGTSESTALNISISGSGSIDTKSVTLVKGTWTEYTCTISGADKETKVTFAASTTKNNRFFLDEVYVYTGEKPSKPVTPTLTLSKESASVEASATTTSFDVQSNTDWTVTTDANWITDWTKTGSNDGTVTIKFDANTAATACTATFTVKTADNAISKTFTLTQKSNSSTPAVKTLLFSEGFGNNTGSARTWQDTYKEQSGINSVYSGASYTITSAKQTKNSVGKTNSGLSQASNGTDATFTVGPLDVKGYENFSVSYYWKAGSIKGTYSTTLYYSIDGTNYTKVANTAKGSTVFVEVNNDLSTINSEKLYLKIIFNTSNTQAVIDDVKLFGYPK